jgi:hypothetical protein
MPTLSDLLNEMHLSVLALIAKMCESAVSRALAHVKDLVVQRVDV